MTYLRSNYPTTIDKLKTLPIYQDMTIEDKRMVGRYQVLIEKNNLTSDEQLELSSLVERLRDKMINSEDWNQLIGAVLNLETYFKDNVLDHIDNKLSGLNTIAANTVNTVEKAKNDAIANMDSVKSTTINAVNQIGNETTAEIENTKDGAISEISIIKNEATQSIATSLNQANDVFTEMKRIEGDFKTDLPILNDCVERIEQADEQIKRLQDASNSVQDDIAKIESVGNKEILIRTSEWTLNGDVYEKEITHNLYSENLHVTAKNSDTKEAVTIGYKILDKTRILLKSDEAIPLSLILSASFYNPLITSNVDEGEIVRARKGESGLDVKIAKIDEQLDTIVHKQEFYTLFLDDYGKYVDDDDWSNAINRALNEPYDNKSKYYGKKIKVEFNPNVNYIIKSKILYNPSLVEIVGNQSKIQVQGMNEDFKVAFEINTGTEYATNFTSLKSLKSLYIKGEGLSNTIGLLFKNCGDLIGSHMRVESFGKNVYIGNNSYLITFFHSNFSNAIEYGVYMPSDLDNYGERITFIDCNIGNSNKSVYNANPNGELFFTNCSFDYNYTGVIDNINGKTYFTDCHFEHSIEKLSNFIICTGGVVKITNGWILGMGNTPKLNYFASGDGRVSLYNVFIHNLRTSSNQLCEDRTHLIMKKTDCYPIHGTSFFTNEKNNLAINDNNREIKDLVCVLESEGEITDRYTSANLTITPSENGIQINKHYGQYSKADFTLLFPIKEDCFIISNKFKIAKLNSAGNGGYVVIEKGICNVDITRTVPKFLKKQIIGNAFNVNFDKNSTKDWTTVESNGMVGYSEKWANYFYIKFSLHVYDGNNKNAYLNIKDLWFETF